MSGLRSLRVLRVGDRVRFDGAVHTVRLTSESGVASVVLLAHLLDAVEIAMYRLQGRSHCLDVRAATAVTLWLSARTRSGALPARLSLSMSILDSSSSLVRT